MEIKSLARKLEPLRPNDVKRWRRVLETADAKTKELVEAHMHEVAREVLGDFDNKVLLSLPSEKQAKGSINLGTILYEKPKWPLGLRTGELLQNLAIFGRSGAGKTNTVFHFVEQLTQKKISWLFWDWKRTARHLLPCLKAKINVYTPGRSLSPFIFNPFIVPPGMESNVYITQLVDIMADAFTLGDGARSILQKAIAACYEAENPSPTVEDVIKAVEVIPGKERVSGWKISAIRALESLAFSKVAGITQTTQEQLARALLESSTIIELDALAESTKQFLIPILSLWLYSVKLAAPEREQLKLVLILEEAHHVLFRGSTSSKETVMNRLLRQCREIGIGIMVVDQHPHLISPAALGNTYTSICMNLKDPTDINKVAALSRVPENEKGLFSTLHTGQGVVKLQDRWHAPILVQFPHIDVAKGAVTDTVLMQYIDGSLKSNELRWIARDKSDSSEIGTGDRLLMLDEFRLLHDVLHHSNDGVDVRYKRLDWNPRHGTAIKDRLLDRGWLNAEIIPQGRTRKIILSVSPKAHELLGPDVKDVPAAFVVHDYWQRYYATVFEDLGYRVEFEAERRGGRVDLLATKDNQRIGVEIETGKSDIKGNVLNCLASNFDKLLLVATDEDAAKKTEHILASNGLMLPQRITLSIRDTIRWGEFAEFNEIQFVRSLKTVKLQLSRS